MSRGGYGPDHRYGPGVDPGYARVSTAKQDLDRQLHALPEVGIAAETGIACTALYRHLPARPAEALTASGIPPSPAREE